MIGVTVTLALAVPLWVEGIGGGGDLGPGLPTAGTDYRAFARAGELVWEGRGDLLYDQDAYAGIEASEFRSLPPFAVMMVPFGLLPPGVGYLIWSLGSVAAFVMAARLLRLPLAFPIVAGVGATGFMQLWTGQVAWFSLLAFAVAYRLAGTGRYERPSFGFVALYKPQLVAGFAGWWVAAGSGRRPRWWADLGVIVAGAALTAVALPEAWSGWLRLVGGILQTPGEDVLALDRVQFSLPAMWRLALGAGAPARIATLVSYLVVAVAAVWVLARLADRPRLAVGMAVYAGLVASPHLLGYDLALLLVPFAAVWHDLPQRRPLWASSAAVLAALATISPIATDVQVAAWGRAVAIGPLALVATGVVLATAVRAEARQGDAAA